MAGWSWEVIDWGKTAATAATIAAVAQAIAAIVMVRGLRHSARAADAAAAAVTLTEANTRAQLRAYVDVAEVEFTGFPVGRQARLKLVIRNFGQTPALGVVPMISAQVAPRTHDAGMAFFTATEGAPLAMIDVAPNATARLYISVPHSAWNEVQSDLLSDAKLAMFKADVTYKDIFGIPHRLQLLYANAGFFVGPDPENVQLVRRETH